MSKSEDQRVANLLCQYGTLARVPATAAMQDTEGLERLRGEIKDLDTASLTKSDKLYLADLYSDVSQSIAIQQHCREMRGGYSSSPEVLNWR